MTPRSPDSFRDVFIAFLSLKLFKPFVFAPLPPGNETLPPNIDHLKSFFVRITLGITLGNAIAKLFVFICQFAGKTGQ